MLKNIRLHLDKDEKKQEQIETALAPKIQETYNRNSHAFRVNIPSLLPKINNISTQNISIFVNKNAELNIVDYGSGRTLYGLHPNDEIDRQYQEFSKHAPRVELSTEQPAYGDDIKTYAALKDTASYQNYMQQDPLPNNVDALVVFGLGIGNHLLSLLRNHSIQHIIVYEPEIQYLQCSVLSIDWTEIFALAKQKGTGIYLQMGKDGRDIVSDVQELAEHVSITRFYYYIHYNHPVFRSITREFLHHSWNSIVQKGIHYEMKTEANDYLPTWTQSTNIEQFHDIDPKTDSQFSKNLAALKTYFPNIYKEFHDYTPLNWLPVKNDKGEINLVKRDSLISWYGDSPKSECILNFKNFGEQPNKDGLVLGYNGTKLRAYTHYRFVKQTEQLLKDVEEDVGSLPSHIKALIMFGVGTGYQLENLVEQHSVEKLFVCEPNRDFFYASLFAINWESVLKKIDESEGRLYINIGDDGTNLFRDLLNQFYAIGPYILNSTYFYQSYFNAELVKAISQLREQLQIVISMGEYFDHAKYGIFHTTESISRGYPHLIAQPYKQLSYEDSETPVFLVGNGPSLDMALETIKEWQDHAVIVSCGTALQVLYKNGIQPDFHAEIEQNRSTFDWCSRIGDASYLKKVSLLSCNGIHPDTCDLFKNVYLAFKEGESSTTSALQVIGEGAFESLKFSFPTVANFALNLVMTMRFKQVYFFGIDLGFHDSKRHHSKQSGYYDKHGNELYDYAAKNNTAITVPGNLRPKVFTKHEFKVSKTIIEQSLASGKVECFNCSDGAKIIGTLPLDISSVLITSTEKQKKQTVKAITQKAFRPIEDYVNYSQHFAQKFTPERLSLELGMFIKRTEHPIENIEQAEALIESQKNMLFASYQEGKSLLFYFLYGTVNYANALFSKLINATHDETKCLDEFNKARLTWTSTLKKIRSECLQSNTAFDVSSSFTVEREKRYVSANTSHYELSCVLPESMKHDFLKAWSAWLTTDRVSFVDARDLRHTKSQNFVISSSLLAEAYLYQHVETLIKQSNRIMILVESDQKVAINLAADNVSFLIHLDHIDSLEDVDDFSQGIKPYFINGHFATNTVKTLPAIERYRFFIPKLFFAQDMPDNCEKYLTLLKDKIGVIDGYIEFPSYLAVPRENCQDRELLIDTLGNRGRSKRGDITLVDLLATPFAETEARIIESNLIRHFSGDQPVVKPA